MSMRAAVQHINRLGFKARIIDDEQVVVQCTCYAATPSGARRVKFVARSVAEAVIWASEHTHEHPTFESAMAECRKVAAERWRRESVT